MANEFLITQTACNTYRVTSTYTSYPLNGFIRKYNETVLTLAVMQTMTPDVIITAGQPNVDLTLDDGVYVLQFYDTDDAHDPLLEYSIPIFVYCSIQSCMNAFNEKLLCADDCPDCADCDPCSAVAEQEYIDNQYEMVKLQTLFWMILGYINWEKIQYYNVYTWTEARGVFISKVGKMFDKVFLIAARCNSCG